MIKVKVYDVGPPYPLNPAPVLWLTDEQEKTLLVLTIGMPEAYAIKSQIVEDAEPPPRPMTHDLLKSVFDHFNATVRSVVITELRENAFYVAEIHVDANGHDITIDSRPSDAIALALRVNAPIFVLEEVMEKAGKEMPPKDDDADADAVGLEDVMDVEIARAVDDSDSPLETARNKLLSAIEEERYEDAARLHDEIRKLEQ